MSTITDVEDAIYTLVATITDVETNLKYEPKRLGKLPMFTQDWIAFDNAKTEVRSDTVEYYWVHRFYVALPDELTAVTQLKALLTSYLAALRTDPTLSHKVIDSRATHGDVSLLLQRDRPMMLLEIDFKARQEED